MGNGWLVFEIFGIKLKVPWLVTKGMKRSFKGLSAGLGV